MIKKVLERIFFEGTIAEYIVLESLFFDIFLLSWIILLLFDVFSSSSKSFSASS